MGIWICPLTQQPGCDSPHMISTDGGLKHIKGGLLMEMEKLGWHQVSFPKRSYYFEYDTTHPSYRERERIGMEDNTEVLQVEIV